MPDIALMSEADIEADVDEMFAAAQRPKRQGGLGPLQRPHATKDRIRRCIVAARGSAVACRSGGRGVESAYQSAVQAATDAERAYAGLVAFLLTAAISAVIQWAIKRWLDRRFG